MSTVYALATMVMGSILLAVILSVVCGKRKLSRHKECSRRDPHIPGDEARKNLKNEIERRIDRVSDIYYEPKLLSYEIEPSSSSDALPYYFRMKAVDNMKYLETEMIGLSGVPQRGLRESMRAFLVNLAAPGCVLSFVEPRIIHELCDYYDHARHHPSQFLAEQFTPFHALWLRILHSARNKDKFGGRIGSSHPGSAQSDHDSAIDEPDADHSGDDENLIITESNIALLHRPSSLKVQSEETPV